jgi:uncharacterized protein (TIGR02147 family)
MMRYLARWYYPVIRELVGLSKFRDNVAWIQEQLLFPVSEAEIRDCLKDLAALKIIVKEGLRWSQAESAVSFGEHVVGEIAVNYQKEMMSLGMRAQDKLGVQDRESGSVTLTLSKADFEKLRKKLIQFRKEIFEEYGETKVTDDHVVQLNLQMFSLTK